MGLIVILCGIPLTTVGRGQTMIQGEAGRQTMSYPGLWSGISHLELPILWPNALSRLDKFWIAVHIVILKTHS